VVTRQRPRSTRLLLAVLVSISVSVISLDYRQGDNGPLAGLGRSTKEAMAPLQGAVTSVTRPIGTFFDGLVHLPSLARQNDDLRNQISSLTTQVARQHFDEQELTTLQGLLGLQASMNPPSVAARVIANGVSNFEWTVTIDKGTDDDIAVDMPVIAGTTQSPMLIGRIVAVTPNSSEVMLILDRNSAVAGKLSVSHQTGLVEGEGPGDLKMTFVDATADVQADEQVYTQGYEVNGQPGLFPPGLLIGQVSHTVPATNELQAFITVRPAADFSNLDFVLVLKTAVAAIP
jgi:rod shape-determining protein MreC